MLKLSVGAAASKGNRGVAKEKGAVDSQGRG